MCCFISGYELKTHYQEKHFCSIPDCCCYNCGITFAREKIDHAFEYLSLSIFMANFVTINLHVPAMINFNRIMQKFCFYKTRSQIQVISMVEDFGIFCRLPSFSFRFHCVVHFRTIPTSIYRTTLFA